MAVPNALSPNRAGGMSGYTPEFGVQGVPVATTGTAPAVTRPTAMSALGLGEYVPPWNRDTTTGTTPAPAPVPSTPAPTPEAKSVTYESTRTPAQLAAGQAGTMLTGMHQEGPNVANIFTDTAGMAAQGFAVGGAPGAAVGGGIGLASSLVSYFGESAAEKERKRILQREAERIAKQNGAFRLEMIRRGKLQDIKDEAQWEWEKQRWEWEQEENKLKSVEAWKQRVDSELLRKLQAGQLNARRMYGG